MSFRSEETVECNRMLLLHEPDQFPVDVEGLEVVEARVAGQEAGQLLSGSCASGIGEIRGGWDSVTHHQ